MYFYLKNRHRIQEFTYTHIDRYVDIEIDDKDYIDRCRYR